MQIKVFVVDGSFDNVNCRVHEVESTLEKRVGAWLKRKGKIEIKNVLQSECSISEAEKSVTLTIFYRQ